MISSIGSIKGTISTVGSLTGSISSRGCLSGKLSFSETYSGEYEVVPSANNIKVLDTKNKVLEDNIRVLKIPYYETSNISNGTTAYIAEEV